MEKQERDIHTTLQQTERAWSESIANEPTSGLEAVIHEGSSQRSIVEERIQSQEVEIAGLGDRIKTGDAAGEMAKEVGNARARLVEMRRQMADLQRADGRE